MIAAIEKCAVDFSQELIGYDASIETLQIEVKKLAVRLAGNLDEARTAVSELTTIAKSLSVIASDKFRTNLLRIPLLEEELQRYAAKAIPPIDLLAYPELAEFMRLAINTGFSDEKAAALKQYIDVVSGANVNISISAATSTLVTLYIQMLSARDNSVFAKKLNAQKLALIPEVDFRVGVADIENIPKLIPSNLGEFNCREVAKNIILTLSLTVKEQKGSLIKATDNIPSQTLIDLINAMKNPNINERKSAIYKFYVSLISQQIQYEFIDIKSLVPSERVVGELQKPADYEKARTIIKGFIDEGSKRQPPIINLEADEFTVLKEMVTKLSEKQIKDIYERLIKIANATSNEEIDNARNQLKTVFLILLEKKYNTLLEQKIGEISRAPEAARSVVIGLNEEYAARRLRKVARAILFHNESTEVKSTLKEMDEEFIRHLKTVGIKAEVDFVRDNAQVINDTFAKLISGLDEIIKGNTNALHFTLDDIALLRRGLDQNRKIILQNKAEDAISHISEIEKEMLPTGLRLIVKGVFEEFKEGDKGVLEKYMEHVATYERHLSAMKDALNKLNQGEFIDLQSLDSVSWFSVHGLSKDKDAIIKSCKRICESNPYAVPISDIIIKYFSAKQMNHVSIDIQKYKVYTTFVSKLESATFPVTTKLFTDNEIGKFKGVLLEAKPDSALVNKHHAIVISLVKNIIAEAATKPQLLAENNTLIETFGDKDQKAISKLYQDYERYKKIIETKTNLIELYPVSTRIKDNSMFALIRDEFRRLGDAFKSRMEDEVKHHFNLKKEADLPDMKKVRETLKLIDTDNAPAKSDFDKVVSCFSILRIHPYSANMHQEAAEKLLQTFLDKCLEIMTKRPCDEAEKGLKCGYEYANKLIETLGTADMLKKLHKAHETFTADRAKENAARASVAQLWDKLKPQENLSKYSEDLSSVNERLETIMKKLSDTQIQFFINTFNKLCESQKQFDWKISDTITTKAGLIDAIKGHIETNKLLLVSSLNAGPK